MRKNKFILPPRCQTSTWKKMIGLPLRPIMPRNTTLHSSQPVAIWLLFGVFMLIVQVVLGGITRLTGSGLSITEWKPIMGVLPPLNANDWYNAFEKYKQIAQYKYMNSSFTLHDFKSIFFWEWTHRLWARLIGIAFVIPFIFFVVKRKFSKAMIRPMVILFLLGALQGLVGWLMVLSGLNDENLYVSHYRLAIHFILALVLICYALWFALGLLIPKNARTYSPSLKKFTVWLIALLTIQLIYGAFMAGLKAAPFAATWPDINGYFLPHGGQPATGLRMYFDNPLVVHFIHRTLAYLIFFLLLAWYFQARKIRATGGFSKLAWMPLALVVLQVLLGILTVLNASYQAALLWLGVMHQFIAMILLLSLVIQFYLLSGKRVEIEVTAQS